MLLLLLLAGYVQHCMAAVGTEDRAGLQHGYDLGKSRRLKGAAYKRNT
jgi:hypothetical protein